MRRLVGITALMLTLGILSGCGPSAEEQATAELVGTQWQWVELDERDSTAKTTVPAEQIFTLEFQEGGTFTGQADCNFIGGTFEIGDESMTIQPGPSTRAYCGDQSLYERYIRLLGEVVSYSIEGSELRLSLASEAGEMQFGDMGSSGPAADAPADMLNVGWMWTGTESDDSSLQATVNQVGMYMISFRENGIANLRADCNNGTGSFIIEGDQIQIETQTWTQAECGSDSLDTQFLDQLEQVESFEFSFGRLKLYLNDKNAVMEFTPS
jgi:heat shock protein HslJ